MIYLLALILGFAACFMSFASEIMAGNIRHLKQGRQPNAGAAMFPTVPVVPLLAMGAAWLLRVFFPGHAVSIFVGSFLLFARLWTVSLLRLRDQFHRIRNSARNANDMNRNS